MLDGNAVGVRADLHPRRSDSSVRVTSQQLQDLALELWLFVSDVRDDVAEYVERCDSGVAGSGYSLHRRHEESLDTEPLVKWSQRHRSDGSCAIGVRDDRSAPSSLLFLPLEETQMACIH